MSEILGSGKTKEDGSCRMQQWHCDDLDLDLDLGLSIAYFSTLSLLFFCFLPVYCFITFYFLSFFLGAGGSCGYFLTFPPPMQVIT